MEYPRTYLRWLDPLFAYPGNTMDALKEVCVTSVWIIRTDIAPCSVRSTVLRHVGYHYMRAVSSWHIVYETSHGYTSVFTCTSIYIQTWRNLQKQYLSYVYSLCYARVLGAVGGFSALFLRCVIAELMERTTRSLSIPNNKILNEHDISGNAFSIRFFSLLIWD